MSADDRVPSAETHWLSFDPLAYAAEFAPAPRSADAGQPLTRFWSIQDEERLMIGNGVDHRLVCPGGKITDATALAARFFYNGEIGAEEITFAEAMILALKIGGKPLTSLGVPIMVPGGGGRTGRCRKG